MQDQTFDTAGLSVIWQRVFDATHWEKKKVHPVTEN